MTHRLYLYCMLALSSIAISSTFVTMSADQEEKCSICFDLLCNESPLSALTCNHLFHTACIQESFKYNTLCPLCKIESNRELFPRVCLPKANAAQKRAIERERERKVAQGNPSENDPELQRVLALSLQEAQAQSARALDAIRERQAQLLSQQDRGVSAEQVHQAVRRTNASSSAGSQRTPTPSELAMPQQSEEELERINKKNHRREELNNEGLNAAIAASLQTPQPNQMRAPSAPPMSPSSEQELKEREQEEIKEAIRLNQIENDGKARRDAQKGSGVAAPLVVPYQNSRAMPLPRPVNQAPAIASSSSSSSSSQQQPSTPYASSLSPEANAFAHRMRDPGEWQSNQVPAAQQVARQPPVHAPAPQPQRVENAAPPVGATPQAWSYRLWIQQRAVAALAKTQSWAGRVWSTVKGWFGGR